MQFVTPDNRHQVPTDLNNIGPRFGFARLQRYRVRQPLYRALAEAGHELLLIVRRSVTPLIPQVAPGARALVLHVSVTRSTRLLVRAEP